MAAAVGSDSLKYFSLFKVRNAGWSTCQRSTYLITLSCQVHLFCPPPPGSNDAPKYMAIHHGTDLTQTGDIIVIHGTC